MTHSRRFKVTALVLAIFVVDGGATWFLHEDSSPQAQERRRRVKLYHEAERWAERVKPGFAGLEGVARTDVGVSVGMNIERGPSWEMVVECMVLDEAAERRVRAFVERSHPPEGKIVWNIRSCAGDKREFDDAVRSADRP